MRVGAVESSSGEVLFCRLIASEEYAGIPCGDVTHWLHWCAYICGICHARNLRMQDGFANTQ